MLEKKNIDLAKAYRLINPGCVFLVSVGDGQRDNLFSVAWNMPLAKDPAHSLKSFRQKTGEIDPCDATMARNSHKFDFTS